MRLIACLMAAGLCLAAEAQAPALPPTNPYFNVSGVDQLRDDDEGVVLARLNAAAVAAEDKDNNRIAGDILAYEELYRLYTRSRLVNLAAVTGQLVLDPAQCAAAPAVAPIRVPNVPDVKMAGVAEAKARLERTLSGYPPALAAVVDAGTARHREAFLAEAKKRGVGGPSVKGMETPVVAQLQKDFACIWNAKLAADVLHLIRSANEPAYAADFAAAEAARAQNIAEGRIPLDMVQGPLFKDRAKEDIGTSPRERAAAGVAPVWPYAEPTDLDIGLAVLRELQQFGCRLEEGYRCPVVLPAGVGSVAYPHVVRAAPCLTGRNGWACKVVIYFELQLPGDVYAGPMAKTNAASPTLSEELFVLTARGWRSPSLNARLAAADQRARVAANKGFAKAENGPLCKAGALVIGGEALQKDACK